MAGSGTKYTPPPSPPSPDASFYDVSDDEEDEYNTIAHSTSGRGVKLLFSKSKVCGLFHMLESRLTSIPPIGLCPSQSIIQGQHPGLYCPHPAEARSGVRRCSFYIRGYLQETGQLVVSPCLGSGIHSRRCSRYLCQGRPFRRVISTAPEISGPSSPNCHLLQGSYRSLCLCRAAVGNLLFAHTTSEPWMVVWKPGNKYACRR